MTAEECEAEAARCVEALQARAEAAETTAKHWETQAYYWEEYANITEAARRSEARRYVYLVSGLTSAMVLGDGLRAIGRGIENETDPEGSVW